MLGCFFHVSDRYWIDAKRVSDRLLVFIRNKRIETRHAYWIQPVTICIELALEQNNENTYWTMIIFKVEALIDFFILFNICILLTSFQRFNELAFSFCRKVFCLFQNQQYYPYINKPTTYRCCHQEVFRQTGVRSKKIFKKV